MKEIELTYEAFDEEVMQSEKPVLVDFWATWCGPCRMLSPIIAQIAEENDDVKVCKVNVDNEPMLAQQFNVMSIPTVIAFKDGMMIGRSVGFRPKEQILSLVK
ncbi:MAG: thioredoxin [Clostridiales bacterium]|nr:thioredoxin [Clostridiales bacterium]